MSAQRGEWVDNDGGTMKIQPRNGRSIVFWSCDDGGEFLTHKSLDEALEDVLWPILPSKLGEVREVFGWARVEMPGDEFILDSVMEALSGCLIEWDNPEESEILESPEIYRAAQVLAATVAQHAKVFACEIVHSEKVKVLDWVRENKPDWLKDDLRGAK